jgi:hypothetical protein
VPINHGITTSDVNRRWTGLAPGRAYNFTKAWVNVYQVLGCKAGDTGASPLPLTREYVYQR